MVPQQTPCTHGLSTHCDGGSSALRGTPDLITRDHPALTAPGPDLSRNEPLAQLRRREAVQRSAELSCSIVVRVADCPALLSEQASPDRRAPSSHQRPWIALSQLRIAAHSKAVVDNAPALIRAQQRPGRRRRQQQALALQRPVVTPPRSVLFLRSRHGREGRSDGLACLLEGHYSSVSPSAVVTLSVQPVSSASLSWRT